MRVANELIMSAVVPSCRRNVAANWVSAEPAENLETRVRNADPFKNVGSSAPTIVAALDSKEVAGVVGDV
jgi:hypothetical protein